MAIEWTDQQIEDLTRMYPDPQFTAAAIAVALFDDKTKRGAVIGKANRLGLSSPISPTQLNVRAERKRTKRKIELERLAAGPGLALRHLGGKTCRWPIRGEGRGTMFCGCETKRGNVYCEPHQHNATKRITEDDAL